MLKRILAFTFISAALFGCASAPEGKRGPLAWDGLGPDPNLPVPAKHRISSSASATRDPNIERETLLSTLRPYSKAWWVVHDEVEAEKETRLATKLVICRRCVPASPPEDRTGTIP